MNEIISKPDHNMRTDFKVLIDIIVQPSAAFKIIEHRPRWGIAFGFLVLLTLVGTLLGSPAQHNADDAVLQQQFTTTTDYSAYTQVGRDALVADAAHPPFWHDLATGGIALLVGMVTALLSSLVLWSISFLRKKPAPYKTFFAAMIHVAIISTALSAVCSGVVTLILGASQFTSYEQLDRAMPSLALLAPDAKDWLAVALGSFTPFALWTASLQGTALFVIASISKKQAIMVASILFVVGIAIQVVLSIL